MANSYIALHSSCFVQSFTFLILMATLSNSTKLVLQLLHRDAVFRPSYTPNLVISNHTINHETNTSLISHDNIESPLFPDIEGKTFLVNISIGEPPVPQLLVMDTASSLTWVQQTLCLGCTSISPFYDPKASSTCKILSCSSNSQCLRFVDLSGCGRQSQCTYFIAYVDASTCRGVIALEKFTFTTSTGGKREISNLVFGYALESTENARKLDGVLGLQISNKYSLVNRVGNKFSYCIGNISNPRYMYNQLVLGEGAVLEGYSTPMRFFHRHYAVSLKGISIGAKQVQINQQDYDFKVVFDSGSSITLLQRNEYEQVKQEVTGLLDGRLKRVTGKWAGKRTCYWGNLMSDVKDFPIVTLHLGEGADFYFDVEGMFRRVGDNIFCMAVGLAGSAVNIIGVCPQQFYNIGYDLNEMRVSFLNIDCELLED